MEDGRDSSRDRLKVRFSKPRTPPLSSRSSAATQGQSPIPSAPLFVKTLARRTRLASWFHSGRKKIDYLHDFGDGWHHDVNLLRVVEDDERHKRKLLGGARAFPPEDCGGLRGYARCVTFVKTGKDPQRDPDEPDSLRVRLGRWSPERFDLEAVRKKFDSRPTPKPAPLWSPSASAARATVVPRERNAWCIALGVDVPDIATVAGRKSVFGPMRLADLVVVALIAHGAPLSDDEVLQRLREAGINDTSGAFSM